jgi:hypothetical protein
MHHVYHVSAAVDIGDLASLVSGVLTLAIVLLTYRSVRVAAASADAAARSAQLADQQLREAQRPVLIAGAPRLDEPPDFLLPLANIGVGPALNVYGTVSVRDTKPGILGPFALHVHPGIAAGEGDVLRFNGHAVTPPKLLGAKITYTDAGGRGYTSELRWDGHKKRFTSTQIKEGDTARARVELAIVGPARDVSLHRRALRRLRHPRKMTPRPAPDGGAPLRSGDIVVGPGSDTPKVARHRDGQ